MKIEIKELITKKKETSKIFINRIGNNLEFEFNNDKYIFEIIDNKNVNIIKKGEIDYYLNLKENKKTLNLIKYTELEFTIKVYTEKIIIEKEKIFLKYFIFENDIDEIISSYEITLLV